MFLLVFVRMWIVQVVKSLLWIPFHLLKTAKFTTLPSNQLNIFTISRKNELSLSSMAGITKMQRLKANVLMHWPGGERLALFSAWWIELGQLYPIRKSFPHNRPGSIQARQPHVRYLHSSGNKWKTLTHYSKLPSYRILYSILSPDFLSYFWLRVNKWSLAGSTRRMKLIL